MAKWHDRDADLRQSRIDRGGTWSQIAGKPELGAGNLLALSGASPPDGIAERAVIDSAYRLSYDAGGLWFAERSPFVERVRLRRLALAESHVTTFDLA